MRLRFLILLGIVGVQYLSIAQATISFSQTRGCGSFISVITLTNNGFCNSPNPEANLKGPGLPIGGITFSEINSNTFTQIYSVNSPGIYILTLSCSNIGTSFPGNLGIFQIEGLSTTSGPDFTISSCEGQQVTVNLQSPVYDKYEIAWGDGITSTLGKSNAFAHTYGDQTQKNIQVIGYYEHTIGGVAGLITSCRNDSTAIAVPYASLKNPEIYQLNVNNLSATLGEVTIDIRTDPRLNYKLYEYEKTQLSPYRLINTLPNTSISVADTIIKSQSIQKGGLNSLSNIYCYKLEAFDDCGNIEPPVTNPALEAQNQMCTLPISGQVDTSGNTITVSSYYPSELTLSIVGINGLTTVSSSLGYPFTYKDTDVVCGLTYLYRAEAKKNQFNQISISAPLTLTALKKSPLAVPQITGFIATIGKTDEKTYLSWTAPTVAGVVAKYNIYLEATPKNNLLGSVTDNTFIPSTLTGKCYLVEATNQCGTSNISKACPPYLQAQKDNLEQNSIQFNNAVTGDNATVGNYILEIYRQGGGNTPYEVRPLSGNSDVQNPIDEKTQVTVYRVIGYLPDGTEIRSNFVSVKQDVRIFMPNAFTPNDDNINDTYMPKGLFWEEFELTIYNRWGQTVFVTSDQNKGWDGGNFNPDIYHYVARVKDQFGEEITKKGTLQLIR